ncbi:MAG: translocation/assembly module TamB [Bryobacteraceae bacterium]|nr:translocation/assembly module TamB [Bryobacteraceae bacterium]
MKRLRKWLLALGLVLSLLGTAGYFVWRSDWLANTIRERAVAEIKKATGATASFGKFDWDWQRGIVRVADLTIRGREAATDPPFVHVALAEVTLKAFSFLSPNVDLRAVKLTKPEVHLITYPDGSTNLPRRNQRPPDEAVAEFIRLGINQLDADKGIFSWNQQEIPFSLRGENLDVSLKLQQDRYQGRLAGEKVSLKMPGVRQFAVTVQTDVTLERNQVSFAGLRAALDGLQLAADGQLRDWRHPVLFAKVKARGPVRDLVTHFDVPLLKQGEGELQGEVAYQDGWTFTGPVSGRNLGYHHEKLDVKGVRLSGNVTYRHSRNSGHYAEVTKLHADSPQGDFRGSLIASSSRYRLRGTVANLRFDDAQHIFDPTLPSWASLVTGPLDIESDYSAVKATAHLSLIPTEGERPLRGTVNLAYDSLAKDVRLSDTHLQSSSTQVDVSGALLGGLNVDLSSANLQELPFVNRLPVQIESGGLVTFHGQVSGGLAAPAARGQLTAKSITYDGQIIERASTQVSARADLLELTTMEVARGRQTVTGSLQVSLVDWQTRPGSSLKGHLAASDIEVAPLTSEAKGRLKGTAELAGTLQDPKLSGALQWNDAVYQGQSLGLVTGQVSYSGEQIDVREGRLAIDRQPLEFSGTYVHEPNDYQNGAFHAAGQGSGLLLERIAQFRERFPSVTGRLEIDGRIRGRLTNGQAEFNTLDGRAVVQQAAYAGKPVGALTIHAKTEASRVNITASGLLRGAAVTAASQWQLNGLMPGQGQFTLQGAKLDDFQDLLIEAPISFDVRLEANGSFKGNLRDPASMTGKIQVSQLGITPRQAMSEVARRDFTLRNEGPLEVTYDAKGFDIKQAKLTAKDTKLTASGLLTTQGTQTANLRFTGDANLAVLSALKADLLAAGNSTLDLTVRGTLAQPLMAGRMELRDASFFLRDVPNGLEKVNGVVFFDRSRARLENLTAQSGGGTIRLGGFIGFGGELSYQLQAQADNVRVRYPEGVSTAVNTSLTLAGSATRSLLSGSVTLLRAALSPRTDLGTLIADSSKSSAAAPRIENEFLKNMQFDVRVDTALNAQVTTSLTQNVEAEVNLRLRGTPARPVLLGRTSFTQGEISFFGTKYTIDRGEVNFYNQTKIEPTINLDLQTRVRGVVVTINFAGPASKLNLSYRSDPPLQSSEILALLTVGRTPSGSVASGANVQSPTFLQGASSALLGQAVAAPLTGRLQRLFGVSRVRIDPQLTGLENTAQARLTIEQQVSRDITVTFITNLNRTQQQIVSVEWDFSREFSALAVRDENGVFGLDFFYRKRFK